MSVAFPIPGGTMTTVLSPCNLEGDGLLLTTGARGSTEAGVYLVRPGRRAFAMAPAFGLAERFELRVDPAATRPLIHVDHFCFWLGLPAFQMRYAIAPREHRPGAAEAVQAVCDAAGIPMSQP